MCQCRVYYQEPGEREEEGEERPNSQGTEERVWIPGINYFKLMILIGQRLIAVCHFTPHEMV